MMIGNPPLAKTLSEMIESGRGSAHRAADVPAVLRDDVRQRDGRAVPGADGGDDACRRCGSCRRTTIIPAYLDAVAAVIRDDLAKLPWEPEHFVISFHGIPQSYAQKGDPYATHVVRTTRELVKRLGWQRERWTQTYQSRFGREEWLKPYTDDVLERWRRRGVKRVFVALPGFTADCLETIDEIGRESREVFEKAGGEHLKNGTCLNDHPKWIEAMARIVRDEGAGWLK